ncbi:SDR family oxidoreductase|uniref:SDR family NAD(P)-dependent oxidoreductase n=1 Tax=Stenotrophomonas sp. SbOxS2 TaxID=2723885 RepID=UPI0015D2BAEB|nr:SDR family oxidoreductase [Stenotrophomonas sp. SbOxS2]NYT99409.1 SDR family oxidoreductase [Stenotrophomonas sp. SbOxS2]
MKGLKDKVIVVAGGGSGIGAVTAARLGSEGATVVVGDISGTGAEKTAAAIQAAGGRALPVTFDLSVEESCADLISSAVSEFGGIDGLFNVGADLRNEVFGRDTDIVDVPVEVWQRTLDVNLTGYFFTCRYAIPRFLERGGGSIVNTMTGLALSGDPTRVSYGVSKAGLLAMTKHIASRWGKQGIRANLVAPGFVLTELALAQVPREEQEAIASALRSPRHGRPEDIAAMVTFLLSGEGEWINGQLHLVNGGVGLG